MDNLLDEKIRYNQLFDLYKKLLTEKQCEYFEYYYAEDYSLSEIAELLKVSRNAVYDQLKIVCGRLDEYEEKLDILKQREKLDRLAKQLRKLAADNAEIQKIADNIEKME